MRPTKRRYSVGGEPTEESHALGHDADLPLDSPPGWTSGQPEDADAAGGRREQAGQHLDGGGFAGAVGAKKAEELTGINPKIHVQDGGEVAEAAGKRSSIDCGRRHDEQFALLPLLLQ